MRGCGRTEKVGRGLGSGQVQGLRHRVQFRFRRRGDRNATSRTGSEANAQMQGVAMRCDAMLGVGSYWIRTVCRPTSPVALGSAYALPARTAQSKGRQAQPVDSTSRCLIRTA
jgi:hypothetical protein